jgi:spore photoproduct lyase
MAKTDLTDPSKVFRTVSVDKEAADTPLGKKFPGAHRVDRAPRRDDLQEGKKHLHISKKVGEALHVCASLNPEYICCNTQVLRSISNCPYTCTYCFLQSYLTNGTTTVIADVPALVEEIKEKTRREPWRFFRIGTWELGDSLALEGMLGTAGELVSAFADLPNAVLEFRTKSDFVEPFLTLQSNGRTIISWTLNPEPVICGEELGTASLDKRLAAMGRVVSKGYLTALHFDPMVYYEGWQTGYDDLVKRIFEVIPPENVAWISIGALRFNPEMKKQIEDNFPRSRLTSAEMVLGGDGKVRYVKPLRVKMMTRLVDAIRKYGGDDPFIYLCMERWDVWQKVLGYAPASIDHLDYLITKSLYDRFPGLVHARPVLEQYQPGTGV